MRKLEVRLNGTVYPILIGDGIRHRTGSLLTELGYRPNDNIIYFVTDSNVGPLYLADCIAAAEQWGYVVHAYVVASGESNKSIEIYQDVISDMISKGLNRKSVVLALGGGVVGDLAGFCAATYMRGISLVQMPTTLLAHDSSVGGKVGINHPLGKNMLGAFHQPAGVFYDTETLRTLPKNEINAGFSELIKEAWLEGADFLEWLADIPSKGIDNYKHYIEEAIFRGCTVKIKYVTKDEKETGDRAFLNFGHTVGHALEQVTQYGRYLHGEAVAIGMVAACRLSERIYGMTGLSSTMENILSSFSLPVRIPLHISTETIIDAMRLDKKSEQGKIVMVLTKGIGMMEIIRDVEEDALTDILESMKEMGE